MAERATFVVVGGGMAAGKAVQGLREGGFDGRLVVVAEEPQLPYERPPLSKGYLAGETAFAELRVNDEDFYAEHEIELLAGTRAVALDAHERRVGLADGRELGFDRLLIASGAVARRPPIPGADDPGVHVLRSVADADALRAAIGPGARLVVIGGGWIGCEVAATARGLGADVTLVERGATPLERVLGPEIGAFFADLHRAHGVRLVSGAGVEGIEERGRRVRLDDGRTIDADVVLLGVGAAPATSLAEAAGLVVDDGIVVDAQLRSSAPAVFAAGDVASTFHTRYGRHVRTEHWDNAQVQGAAAARSMLGAGEAFADLPYFFSDQFDLGLEYVGLHGADDRLVIRGSMGDERFQAFWIGPDGRVVAAMHVNDWDAIDALRLLVEHARPLPEATGA